MSHYNDPKTLIERMTEYRGGPAYLLLGEAVDRIRELERKAEQDALTIKALRKAEERT